MRRAGSPPASADELADRCRTAGLVLERPVEPSDLDQALAVIDAWTQVVDATDEREKAELVNAMPARSAAYPRLTDHARAAAGCETIFADTSRNARQRHCSQPCANRDAVRRHRARRSTPAT
ncbi:CGNR zinc finger domain-containing protein [Spongiactinospora sp. TRM90649]|uniref:CGNR zinc finger domain-containing protein n=1 Tax=Spongiactinospora sp. TRM90649 TaxID=3031114 RepID=UPI0023F7BB74|nr:CGNR zinc finger domain-containing protein [Spongiactinospora sp. TRM90649]MDF5755127.1 CGNR zinc finger domain-containing protein [Spongiactinospora sp. TRM90649]